MFIVQSVCPAISCGSPSPPAVQGLAALNATPERVSPREGDQRDEAHNLHWVTPRSERSRIAVENNTTEILKPVKGGSCLCFVSFSMLVLNRKQA